jgi:hypothetical protein
MSPFRTRLTPVSGYRHAGPLTIRWAARDDAERLEILAELDEAPIPPAPLMLGFVAEDLWVAASLATGEAICDPFKPSAEIAGLVAERGRQLTVAGRRPSFGPMRRLRRRSPAGLEARLGHSAG